MTFLATRLALLLLAAGEPKVAVEDLGWMAGSWITESEGRWTEEEWTAPRGGVMLGHSRSGRGETLRAFEFLQLQAGTDGVLAYIARPQGGEPVAFGLVQQDATSATFENAAHDYPQRIRYERIGAVMKATISRIDGSGAQSWVYRRR